MHRPRATQQQQDGRSTAVRVQSFAAQKETRSRAARASSLNPPSSPPTMPEFARRAPTGSQQGTGSYVRTYGITARIPSLEVDPPAIGSYGPQKHTFLNSTPFPISEKTLTIDYPLERD